jgi:hypothetical protein
MSQIRQAYLRGLRDFVATDTPGTFRLPFLDEIPIRSPSQKWRMRMLMMTTMMKIVDDGYGVTEESVEVQETTPGELHAEIEADRLRHCVSQPPPASMLADPMPSPLAEAYSKASKAPVFRRNVACNPPRRVGMPLNSPCFSQD